MAEYRSKKKLPVGIEFFDEMQKQEYYYVDKTGLIVDLMKDRGKVNLFTRPRRFGKTMNMSMLKSFFEIGSDKDIFEGLTVSKDTTLCENHMGRYPVVFLTLNGVDGATFEKAYERLKEIIRKEARRHQYLFASNKLSERDLKMSLLDSNKNLIDGFEYPRDNYVEFRGVERGKTYYLKVEDSNTVGYAEAYMFTYEGTQPGYTVEFNPNGGKNLSSSGKTVTSGQAIGTLPTVSRDGYMFTGWYTASSGGTRVTSGTIITQDQIFYAQWKKIQEANPNIAGITGTSASKLIEKGQKRNNQTTKGNKQANYPYKYHYDICGCHIMHLPSCVFRETGHWIGRLPPCHGHFP